MLLIDTSFQIDVIDVIIVKTKDKFRKELREKGIIVHINKGLKNYSWAIPYYQLHTYKTEGFSIHAQGNFVRFKSNKLLKENKQFIDKVINCKIENNKQYDFQ